MKKQCVGIELRALNNLIKRFMDAKTNKKEVDSITGTNGWIIAYIAHHEGDVFQRDLEKEFCITRSTASKVVNLMVQKGLIERQTVCQDARLKKLVLTPKAIAVSEKMQEGGKLLESTLTKGFSQEEIQVLLSSLERLKNNIQLQ